MQSLIGEPHLLAAGAPHEATNDNRISHRPEEDTWGTARGVFAALRHTGRVPSARDEMCGYRGSWAGDRVGDRAQLI
jgi:hypothetical protein